MPTFYVTTPIYYVNALPHLGHAYTTILADTTARFRRLRGDDVYFLTGTDEHGDKIAQAAAAAGEDPQVHVDRISALFQDLWAKLGITHDQFIRTTSPKHKQAVQKFLTRIHDSGDIIFGEYSGKYCTGCERFYLDKELLDGKCPDHQKPPVLIKEQNYFFKMSRYQDWLIDHIRKNPDFIRPEHYRNEVLSFLKEPLEDLCISRPRARLSWGIPLPFDDRFVTYVWFDALINYISALDWPDGDLFQRYWPSAQHLIAKDILKPHAIYWPTMLHAAGIEPYRHLNVHGYWRLGGGKMSKSVGKVVSPLDLADHYGQEGFRYFLLREMIFGQDANFNEEAMISRINSDLANDLGNLLHRTLNMIHRYQQGKVLPAAESEPMDQALRNLLTGLADKISPSVDIVHVHTALASLWEGVRKTNEYIEQAAPWKLNKEGRHERLATVMYHLAESLRILATLLSPFLPSAAENLWKQLGQGGAPVRSLDTTRKWGYVENNSQVQVGVPLFPRIEEPKPADGHE